ncbi:hypothetical protein [Nocardia aurea]|uniref:hypothetical protein n=1 Tax=Nocardia aurea TaxID=2144174 RepID=UPI0033B7EF8A
MQQQIVVADHDLVGEALTFGGLVAAFGVGCKEYITGGADSNLIPIILLNTEDATLVDAFEHAAALVRAQFAEFQALRAGLTARCAALADTALGTALGEHIDDLTAAVQATWVWQVDTARYKSTSIFTETTSTELGPLTATADPAPTHTRCVRLGSRW